MAYAGDEPVASTCGTLTVRPEGLDSCGQWELVPLLSMGMAGKSHCRSN